MKQIEIYTIIIKMPTTRRSSSRSRSAPKPKLSKDGKSATYKGKKYEVKEWKNGTRYIDLPFTSKDGKKGTRPRIVAGSSPEYLSKIRSKSRTRRSSRRQSLTKRNQAAMRAFVRHYEKAGYKTEKGRKIAMTRDIHGDNQPQTRSLSKFRKSPHKLDMRGVDMGEFKTTKALKKASKSRKSVSK